MKEVIAISYRTCSIDGCTNKHDARGYCSTHYGRYRRYGDPLYIRKLGKDQLCEVQGCSKNQYARGYCSLHWRRWHKYGDPLKTKLIRASSMEDYFLSHTAWEKGCLIWTGGKTGNGYGLGSVEGKKKLAHRYAWERAKGPIPKGAFIDHICHTRACVNVEHLRLTTNQQNTWNRSGATPDNVSGFRNVARHGRGWRVVVTKDGVPHRFGTYPTVEEAAVVAEQARKDLFGDYAGRG